MDPEDEHGRTFAEVIAEKTVLKAARDCDLHAVREILDRTEGKARQTIHLTTDRREQLERMVNRYMEDEQAAGNQIDREGAIKNLSVFEPQVSELLN